MSNVAFARGTSGRLYWDFYLTNSARSFLGAVVTVSMPYAYLNGRAINPPYGPHTRPSTYDFHGSVDTVAFIGGGNGRITTGDVLTFYWYIAGQGGRAADRYISCRVPAPGEG